MKTIVITNPDNPAKSLFKTIYYPDSSQFPSKATTYATKFEFSLAIVILLDGTRNWLLFQAVSMRWWLWEHEVMAVRAYKNMMSKKHWDLYVKEAGFFMNHSMPFFGASPDGKRTCACCQDHLLGTNCLLCNFTKETIEQRHYAKQLQTNHQYYYQVQNQRNVCGTR